MSRKDDLEQLLRDSYEIIAENQQIIQVSSDLPTPRKRAQREIKNQWDFIEEYLSEYIPLCLATQTEIPTDIVQILARFPSFISQIAKIANSERVLVTAANELLVQIKLAEENLSAFDEIPDKRNYGREIAELRELVEKYRSDIRNLQFLRRDREPQILDIPKYLEGVSKEFEEWERKYTSLRLTHELKLTAWYGEVSQIKHENRPKELSVREAVREYDRLIILGEPGSGKTTSLKRMALEYAQETRRVLNTSEATKYYIPLFVQLGNYVDRASQGLAQYSHENILWLIGDSFQSNLRNTQTETTLDDVKLTLNSYQFIFFFDGLNEVAEDIRPKCAEAIRKFARLYENHKYVITSRKHGYINTLDYETLEILDLSLEDISQYVARYLDIGRAKKLVDQLSPQLRRIAQNPLVLRIMIDVFEKKEQLPRSRGKLLERYAELMLERDVAERGASLYYPKADDIQFKLSICVPVGYWMQTGGQYIQESVALQIIENKLDELNRRDVLAAKLIDDLCNSRLLERVGLGFVRFWHQTIQEYFAAVQISSEWQAFINGSTSSDKKRAKKSIENYIKNPVWHETFAISAGLLDTRQLHLLIRYLRHRNIPLMAVCIGNSENFSEGDEKTILTSLYNYLNIWKYLSPEPIKVIERSLPVLILALGYWIIKGHPAFQFLWSHGFNGYEVFYRFGEIDLFSFVIPVNSVLYSALVWYWSWPPAVLTITNIVFPTTIMTTLLFLTWKGLDRLNELIFAKRVYNYLTALRHIGTVHARDVLAQLSLETQTNVWVHPQYKVAILASQMVSADTEAELLGLLLNENSRLYAIEVLGEIATDKGVDKLNDIVDHPDELVARGAIGALTKVAEKRDYQKEKIAERFLSVLIDKTKPFSVRLEAYQGLNELKIEDIDRPWPNFTDATRLWSKIHRPAIAILAALTVFLVMNMTIWSYSDKSTSNFFYDDLNAESSRWGPANESEQYSIAYVGGGLEITSKVENTGGWVAQRLLGYTYKDFTFMVDAKSIAGDGSYGVFFRSPDQDHRYVFAISEDGYYRIYTVTRSDNDFYPQELTIDQGSSPAIVQGTNHISVLVRGNIAYLSVNGEKITQIVINEPVFAEGNIGLIVARSFESASNFTVHFDNTRTVDPHAILPFQLEPFREPIGLGIVGLIFLVAVGLMYGYPTLIRIAKFPFNNSILLLSFAISLPVYIFVLWPTVNEHVSSKITAMFVSIWWVSLLIGYTFLLRERNFILNFVLLIATTAVVIPFAPIIAIYFVIKTVSNRFIKPKQQESGAPNTRYILPLRVQLFDQLGMYGRVISELEHSAANLRVLQPDLATADYFSDVINELSWRYYRMGNLEKAGDLAQEGINLKLKHIERFYNLLGAVNSDKSAYKDALKAYSEGIEISPESIYIRRNRIEVYLAIGDIKKASEDYKIAQKLEPQNSSTPMRFATILEAEKNYESAIEYYRKSLLIDNKRADARFGLGLCLLRIGKSRESQKEYEKGLRHLSGYGAKRDLAEAIKELRKSIGNLPLQKDAEEILIMLEQKLNKNLKDNP